MNILAAHLNTSRATEIYLTNLELADIGHQNIVYHIILSSLVLLRSHKTDCIVQYSTKRQRVVPRDWLLHRSEMTRPPLVPRETDKSLGTDSYTGPR